MALNTTLKIAIVMSGMTQTDIAHKTGIHESKLSQIIRGHRQPSDLEKRLIAKTLRVAVDHLFAEEATA